MQRIHASRMAVSTGTLPWRMRDGWKEFHLVAEPVVREIAPGMKANLWGYNGQSPGPTIEVVEGDRVIHRVETCQYPNWVGQVQERMLRFEGDRLHLLTPAQKTRRGLQTSTVAWRRA